MIFEQTVYSRLTDNQILAAKNNDIRNVRFKDLTVEELHLLYILLGGNSIVLKELLDTVCNYDFSNE